MRRTTDRTRKAANSWPPQAVRGTACHCEAACGCGNPFLFYALRKRDPLPNREAGRVIVFPVPTSQTPAWKRIRLM